MLRPRASSNQHKALQCSAGLNILVVVYATQLMRYVCFKFLIGVFKRGIPVMSYQFKKKMLYRDGAEHLVSEPLPVKLSLPGFPVIREILELRSRGDAKEIWRRKLPWKLAKLCIMHRLYVLEFFNYCRNCFFYNDCAFPRNPCWFITHLNEKEAQENISELLENNEELRKKTIKCIDNT